MGQGAWSRAGATTWQWILDAVATVRTAFIETWNTFVRASVQRAVDGAEQILARARDAVIQVFVIDQAQAEAAARRDAMYATLSEADRQVLAQAQASATRPR